MENLKEIQVMLKTMFQTEYWDKSHSNIKVS